MLSAGGLSQILSLSRRLDIVSSALKFTVLTRIDFGAQNIQAWQMLYASCAATAKREIKTFLKHARYNYSCIISVFIVG